MGQGFRARRAYQDRIAAMLRSRLVILTVAAALALALGLRADHPLRAQDPPSVTITSTLPTWRAPGGRLAVRGTAPPEEELALYAGTARLATTTSAADGSFLLRGRAPARGRYDLSVHRAGEAVVIGRLRVRALRLAAVGDVNLGDRVGRAIAAYGPRYPWRFVAPALRAADVAVANLECAVSRRGAPMPKQYTFRGSPRSLRAAASYAGIDVVSLANNHSLDYGRVAFADTIAHARRFGLATIGGGRNLAAAGRPAVVRAGGLRVALLAFSDVRPPGFDAGPATSGATPAFPWIVSTAVRRAKRRADVVVAYFHWGSERTLAPSARQRDLAALAFRSGAGVVLGAHPHVLQPIERPGARRLVAWSLGNFVFGANSPATARTGILTIRLGARGVLAHSFRRARIGGPYSVQPRLGG